MWGIRSGIPVSKPKRPNRRSTVERSGQASSAIEGRWINATMVLGGLVPAWGDAIEVVGKIAKFVAQPSMPARSTLLRFCSPASAEIRHAI
jgi:hypothetical protein